MNELSASASFNVADSSARDRVEKLEESLLKVPQVDCPVRHYFSEGLFAREITIPKGTVLVGVVHKQDSLVIVSSGVLRYVTDDGVKEVSAPATLTVKAGMKNCGFAVETVVWTNIYPNPDNEKNLDVLCERYTEAKASDLLGGSTNKQLSMSGTVSKLEN